MFDFFLIPKVEESSSFTKIPQVEPESSQKGAFILPPSIEGSLVATPEKQKEITEPVFNFGAKLGSEFVFAAESVTDFLSDLYSYSASAHDRRLPKPTYELEQKQARYEGLITDVKRVLPLYEEGSEKQTEALRKISSYEEIINRYESRKKDARLNFYADPNIKYFQKDDRRQEAWLDNVIPQEVKDNAHSVTGGWVYDAFADTAKNVANFGASVILTKMGGTAGPFVAMALLRRREAVGAKEELMSLRTASGEGGMTEEFVNSYAERYSYGSFIIEYLQQLAYMGSGAFKKHGTKEVFKKFPFWRKAFNRIVPGAGEGALEEVAQDGLLFGITGEAVRAWQEKTGEILQFQEPDLARTARAGTGMGIVIGTGGAATVDVATTLQENHQERAEMFQQFREEYEATEALYHKTETGFELSEGTKLDRTTLPALVALNTSIPLEKIEVSLRIMIDQKARAQGLTSQEWIESNISDTAFNEEDFAKKLGKDWALQQAAYQGTLEQGEQSPELSPMTDPKALAQFIGKQAQRKDPKANSQYREALAMKREGKSSEEIRNKTGWFQLDEDDNWRLPLSDKGMDINQELYEKARKSPSTESLGKLKDFYNSDRKDNVIALYGDILGDIDVFVKDLDGDFGVYKSSDKENGGKPSITLDPNLWGSRRGDVLRHEVQHAIGDIEGFQYESETEKTQAELKPLREKLQGIKESQIEIMERFVESPDMSEERQDILLEMRKSGNIAGAIEARIAEVRYEGKLGEVEARSAEVHVTYTDEQLKQLHPLPVTGGQDYYNIDKKSQDGLESKDQLHRTLRQKANGAVGLMQDGRHLLGLFEGANVSTIVHEFTHIATRSLGENQARTLAKWAGVDYGLIERYLQDPYSLTDAEFTQARKFEEKFAEGFVEYLRRGKAPIKSLKGSFRAMKEWLTQIFEAAKTQKMTIPNNIKAVFDELLLGEQERFGGEIRSRSLSVNLQVSKDTTVGEQAVVAWKINGKLEKINVDNLVKGKAATQQQKNLLGNDVAWHSPFKETFKASQMEFRGLTRVNLDAKQIDNMNEKQLGKLATFMKIIKPKDSMNTEQLRTLLKVMATNEALFKSPSTSEAKFTTAQIIRAVAQYNENNPFYKGREWLGLYFSDLITQVENSGKAGDFGAVVGNEARRSCDHARSFQGKHTKQLLKVLKLSRGALLRNKNSHLAELQEILWNSDDAALQRWGRAKFQLAVEDLMDLSELSPEAVELVLEFKKLVKETGISWEEAGMKMESQDGKPVLFKHSKGGSKLIRRFTPDAWRIFTLDGPDGDYLRKQLAEILSEVSGGENEISYIKQRIDSIRENRNTKHIAQETMRMLEDVPTHIKIDGKVLQLLHTDPSNVASRMVYEMGLRYGFVKSFGQEEKLAERYANNFRAAGGNPVHIERLFRALNGIPVVESTRVKPGSLLAHAFDIYNSFLNIWKPMKLTVAAINNIFETPGKIPAYMGTKEYAQTLFNLMNSSRHGAAGLQALVERIEELGGMSIDVESLFLMSEGKMGKVQTIEKLTRILGQKIGRASGMQASARANELIAGLTAERLNENLLKGEGTAADIERLTLLKFTPEEIGVLLNARERTDLHDAVVSRSPAITQGTNLLPAERSLFHNWAYAKDIIAFDSYAVNTIKRLIDVTHNAVKLGKTPRGRMQAWKILAEYMVGHAASGAMQTGIRQFMKYGKNAWLYADWDEDDDGLDVFDMAKKIGEWLVYSMWGGPAAHIAEAVATAKGIPAANTLIQMFLPRSSWGEFFEVILNKGRYKNMSWSDGVLSYLKAFPAISSSAATFLSTLGLGTKDVKLSYARNQYYSWAKKHVSRYEGGEFYDLSEDAETNKLFYRHIAKAASIMNLEGSIFDTKEEQTARVRDELSAAVGMHPAEFTDWENRLQVANALERKMLVNNLRDKDRIKFEKAVHPEVYLRLRTQDAILHKWAEKLRIGQL